MWLLYLHRGRSTAGGRCSSQPTVFAQPPEKGHISGDVKGAKALRACAIPRSAPTPSSLLVPPRRLWRLLRALRHPLIAIVRALAADTAGHEHQISRSVAARSSNPTGPARRRLAFPPRSGNKVEAHRRKRRCPLALPRDRARCLEPAFGEALRRSGRSCSRWARSATPTTTRCARRLLRRPARVPTPRPEPLFYARKRHGGKSSTSSKASTTRTGSTRRSATSPL